MKKASRRPTNKYEMMKLETHYFTAIIVIIDSGKNYQWIVEVANESLKRKCMLIDLQNTAPQISY